jgi:hypothetical protein
MDNTLEVMTPEDAKAYLSRKLLEISGKTGNLEPSAPTREELQISIPHP